MAIELYDYQLKAIEQLRNGSILCGGVGTGKSRTALTYYYTKECRGEVTINGKGSWGAMKAPRDLYIITTAKKRDSKEWEKESAFFCLTENRDTNPDQAKMSVDSWNNIKKYTNVENAFFIFDEQRVVGYGSWVKSFLKISRHNKWILLSATPGDTWSDYIPVFIANGFYKNKSEFARMHIVYNRFAKYPKIDRYINTSELKNLRNRVVVLMKSERKAKQHHFNLQACYDEELYSRVFKDRWDIYDDKPIKESGKLCYLMRKVVNSDPSRVELLRKLLLEHPKMIVFYNYDYELDILRSTARTCGIPFSEWNGQKHEELQKTDRWLYFVQYSAGAEGWNCIETDTILFFSQTYSYRMLIQAAGRIDRVNTPYSDLYYFHIRSNAPIDMAIQKALKNKKNFNEKTFIKA